MTSVTENVGIMPPGKNPAPQPTASVQVAGVGQCVGNGVVGNARGGRVPQGRHSASKSASQSPRRRSERTSSDDKGLFAPSRSSQMQQNSSPLSPKASSRLNEQSSQSSKSRNHGEVSENGKKNPFLTVPVPERKGRRHRHRHRPHSRRHNSVEHRSTSEDALVVEKYTSTLTLILGNNRSPVSENNAQKSSRKETKLTSLTRYSAYEGNNLF